MVERVRYNVPRGSIHSIAELQALSDGRCELLIVSERTLYLIHNLANLDIGFSNRYAVTLDDHYYYPLENETPEWGFFEQVVNAFRLEVMPMTCDIERGLTAIADAIAGLSIRGGACDTAGGVVRCVVEIPNDELLGPGDSEQGDPVTENPPEGFDTWAEYFTYKCQAAHLVWSVVRGYFVASRALDLVALSGAVVGPIFAGLAGLLPAVFTPAGFVAFVAAIVAIGLASGFAWFFMDQAIDWWDDNRDDIVCALYNSGSSPEAVAAVAGAIEDAIQAIVVWGALSPIAGTLSALLGDAFSLLAGNGLVEPLFKTAAAVASVGEVDCSDCEGAGSLLETSYYSPYNVLLEGDQQFPSAGQISSENGYRTFNEGGPASWNFDFIAPTPAPTATRLTFTLVDGSGDTNIDLDIQYVRVGAEYLINGQIQVDCCGPYSYSSGVIGTALVAGERYRVILGTPEVGRTWWIRHVRVSDAS